MMDQFKVRYYPGGMGLDHSSWWVVVTVYRNGELFDLPVKYLRRADYN
jgi:hypothetical protein